MNQKILAFVEKLEIFKTKIKALHWDSNSLSQHELCDDIADRIADFQDQVSEVEQSISGKLPKNMFRPDNQEFGEIGTLKEFVENVLDATNKFYKELENMGDDYIGMRSDCESFLSDMQRKLYLVNFTLKEELKRRLANKLNESMPKKIERHDDIDKFIGRKPKTMRARINQIYRIVKKYGIDSRVYSDEHWQAVEDYYKAITSLGCEVEMKPCANVSNVDSMQSDGGYCDYAEDGMPRSKQYAIKISFDDGMNIEGYIKCMAAGTVSDPFSRYDTCIVLWPKNNRVLEIKDMKGQIKLTEEELKQIIKEAATKIIQEYGNTLKGAYNVGKLAARKGFRDKKPHDGALILRQAHSEFNDDKKAEQLYNATKKGYQDGQNEFRNESIEIKPENKGKFNATKKATGKSTEELTHSKNPITKKRAIFAKNSKKWNKK